MILTISTISKCLDNDNNRIIIFILNSYCYDRYVCLTKNNPGRKKSCSGILSRNKASDIITGQLSGTKFRDFFSRDYFSGQLNQEKVIIYIV